MTLFSFLTELGPFWGTPIVTVEDVEEHNRLLNTSFGAKSIPAVSAQDAYAHLGHGEYIIYPRGKNFGYDFNTEELIKCVSDEENFPPFAKEWLSYQISWVEPVINLEDEEDEKNYLLIVLKGNAKDEDMIKQADKDPIQARFNN